VRSYDFSRSHTFPRIIYPNTSSATSTAFHNAPLDRAFFLKTFQNTSGINNASVSDFKINYMGIRKTKLIKAPLNIIGDQLDFCSDPGKKFFRIC
jgi:hypothetical protein